MLRLKPGVKLADLSPRMDLASKIVDGAYSATGIKECWITSSNDSTHSDDSRHYPRNTETGMSEALDFRLHNVPAEMRQVLVNNVKMLLGGDAGEFDVVWEAKGTDNEHLHVEWDPR